MISVGRAPESSLILDDPQVSGRHALIYVENGKVHIADLGSTNGVFVNGERITQAPITPFDDVRVGECRLKVEMPGGTADDGPPSPERTLVGEKIPPPPRESTDPTPVRAAPASSVQRVTPDMEMTGQEEALPPEPSPFDAVPREPAPRVEVPTTRARPPRDEPRTPPPAEVAPEAPAPQVTSPDAPRARGRSRSAPIRDPEPAAAPPPPPPPDALSLFDDEPAPPKAPAPRSPEPAAPPRASPAAPPQAPRVLEPAAPMPPPRPVEPAAPPPPPPAVVSPAPEPPRAAARATPIREKVREPRKKGEPAPRTDGSAALELMPPAEHEELDEEELEERSFVPPFSLLDNVVRDRMQDGVKGQARPVLEVIRYRGGRLLDVARLDPGSTYLAFDEGKEKRTKLVQARRDGKARLFIRPEQDGNVVMGGRAATIAAMCSPQHVADKKRGIFAADLAEGDYAQVKIPGGGYLLRFVRSPEPPPSRMEFKLGKEERNYGIAGLAGIVIMLAGIVAQAYLSPPELIVSEEAAEFAEVSLKDLEMEKPPEPPPPPPPAPPEEVKVEAPAPPPVPEPAPKPDPRPRAKTKARAASPGPPPPPNAPPPPPSAAQNALAALDNLGPPTSAPKLSTAVSNIAAVRVPAGAPSSFAVAGAIGKLPGNEVTVSTGGRAGGRDTRAAAALLAGKDVGSLKGGGGTGQVRGKLTRPPARSVGTQGGSLAREEILKVVASAFGAINSCYERQLMKDGTLEGKLVIDWVIDPGGGVSSTRVRSSTIRSAEVASCVSSVIRGLRFPKPTGGSVTVTFPFAFRSASF